MASLQLLCAPQVNANCQRWYGRERVRGWGVPICLAGDMCDRLLGRLFICALDAFSYVELLKLSTYLHAYIYTIVVLHCTYTLCRYMSCFSASMVDRGAEDECGTRTPTIT